MKKLVVLRPKTYPHSLASIALYAAIACCAFELTDVAHECLGHGGAYAFLGGREFILTTTRVTANGPGIDPDRLFSGQQHGDVYARLYSVAGPLSSLLVAAICLGALRRFSNRLGAETKVFLWLSAAFNMMWACGYISYSGVTGSGDFFELVRGGRTEPLMRVVLIVLGVWAYAAAIKVIARSLPNAAKNTRLIWTAYVSAVVIASLGAAVDPRGPSRIWHDALPETAFANLGLLWIAKIISNERDPQAERIHRSGWIAAGLVFSILYVMVLGPGLQIRW